MEQNEHERTYQFISDPSHKENVSGRVTAACLNCRKKKIKCSGLVNCVQCQEKGLVCEGPPSRKRPKREHHGSSSSHDLTQEGNPTSSRPRELPALVEHDSGYSTIQPDGQSSTPGASPSTTGNPGPLPTTIETSGSMTVPSAYVSQFLHSSSLQSPSSYNEQPSTLTGQWDSSTTYTPGASSFGTASIASGLSELPDYTTLEAGRIPLQNYDTSTYGFWPSNDDLNRRPSSFLVQTAEALESQAQRLRGIVQDRQNEELDTTLSHFPLRDLPLHDASYPQGFEQPFRDDGSLRSDQTPDIRIYGVWPGQRIQAQLNHPMMQNQSRTSQSAGHSAASSWPPQPSLSTNQDVKPGDLNIPNPALRYNAANEQSRGPHAGSSAASRHRRPSGSQQ
ncbi:hypothetical protein BAUCODRAFT_553628 [Baudoinia panamericana UAMH 10762]|uniref:Zn(2)-C6 fungal-type domain-containing protein n=1 Tax=Baudoinia panamericana (strain UAMH 10762) TaxID=717646 RepID=M2N6D2_BAUPA|nr:uncharacterized protein BAUCODRAFT_553628 [Baudoinia panamericana UAMH 10762]EMC94599.1 hypothetical protein BAUCODRAFT_553628 [Baudoinia panamericana UAMH 10762]